MNGIETAFPIRGARLLLILNSSIICGHLAVIHATLQTMREGLKC